jgi:hypothetical protein
LNDQLININVLPFHLYFFVCRLRFLKGFTCSTTRTTTLEFQSTGTFRFSSTLTLRSASQGSKNETSAFQGESCTCDILMILNRLENSTHQLHFSTPQTERPNVPTLILASKGSGMLYACCYRRAEIEICCNHLLSSTDEPPARSHSLAPTPRTMPRYTHAEIELRCDVVDRANGMLVISTKPLADMVVKGSSFL